MSKTARKIVEEVRRPVLYIGENTYERPGVKLDEKAVDRLLHEAWEVWRTAMDDYEMRRKKDKPKKALEDNWDPDEPELVYDYGEYAGAGLEDWDIFWRDTYYRGPGGKVTDPPVEPLCMIYSLVRDFWTEATGGRDFWLNYPKSGNEEWLKYPDEDSTDEDETEQEDPDLFSSAGRLFLGVARVLHRRYTPLNCESVQGWATTSKKKRRKHRKYSTHLR